eukprot:11167150-Lingulodinium_polyedra.AAC.1
MVAPCDSDNPETWVPQTPMEETSPRRNDGATPDVQTTPVPDDRRFTMPQHPFLLRPTSSTARGPPVARAQGTDKKDPSEVREARRQRWKGTRVVVDWHDED